MDVGLESQYLQVFGARVLATDPAVSNESVAPGVELVALESLLAGADMVTIHVNLDESTKRFFGCEQFASMKTGAWLVNTGRGELIDEAAFLEAMQGGRLAGAAIDVLSDESCKGMDSNPLVRYAKAHDNLLITPHMGGCTFESVAKTEVFLAEKLHNLLSLATLHPQPPAGPEQGDGGSTLNQS